MTILVCFCVLAAATAAGAAGDAKIAGSELHYEPRHPEVLVGPPAQPAKETPLAAPAAANVRLGGSLEQLLREGGREGSSFQKTKKEFAAYLVKFEALAARKTVVLQKCKLSLSDLCLLEAAARSPLAWRDRQLQKQRKQQQQQQQQQLLLLLLLFLLRSRCAFCFLLQQLPAASPPAAAAVAVATLRRRRRHAEQK
ncbi:hypothetical protein ETH_00022140 [Eimeria tenella]|uniref:Uncharacterized protein n=1 Tax=Eimeria tenella TaxID=5802 RepID=U6L554_EIMTE|nr:hypothetical protein ETH_00022140 [Eimeria tenella]CDJ45296.1 hypothetical protein ETH_00022140 [Eimeria tenella]|eukprot:XP_013236042.1 hypothetical protein ETH_00022140 [Eimeria tenella]